MKKITLLLGVLFLSSCSNENSENNVEKNVSPLNSKTESFQRGPTSCLLGYTISIATSTISTYGATISWDTSDAIYCDLTSAKIQVRPINDCPNQTGLGVIQNYPITNFLIPSTNSMEITSAMVGKKCMMWRLVIDGGCADGQSCNTSTPWQYFQLVP